MDSSDERCTAQNGLDCTQIWEKRLAVTNPPDCAGAALVAFVLSPKNHSGAASAGGAASCSNRRHALIVAEKKIGGGETGGQDDHRNVSHQDGWLRTSACRVGKKDRRSTA